MEFWTGLAKHFQVAAAKPLAKARRELAPGAMQPAAWNLIAENLREQAKREQAKRGRDLPERVGSALPPQRLAQPAPVFSAPVRRELIPLRDQSGHG